MKTGWGYRHEPGWRQKPRTRNIVEQCKLHYSMSDAGTLGTHGTLRPKSTKRWNTSLTFALTDDDRLAFLALAKAKKTTASALLREAIKKLLT
jgi:hypothetical protein